jgi:hypothetical protein
MDQSQRRTPHVGAVRHDVVAIAGSRAELGHSFTCTGGLLGQRNLLVVALRAGLTDVGLCHHDCEPDSLAVLCRSSPQLGHRNRLFPIGAERRAIGWHHSIVRRLWRDIERVGRAIRRYMTATGQWGTHAYPMTQMMLERTAAFLRKML